MRSLRRQADGREVLEKIGDMAERLSEMAEGLSETAGDAPKRRMMEKYRLMVKYRPMVKYGTSCADEKPK